MNKLVQDTVYSEMWRIKWWDGRLSDMINKTRAKDAIARFKENQKEIQSSTAFKRPPRAFRKLTGAFK